MFNKKGFYFDAPNDGKGGDDPTKTATSPEGANDKKFTQTEVDRIVEERLQRERKAQKDKDDETKRQAEAEAAKKQGEWQKVAEQREADLKRLQVETREKDIKILAVQKGIKDPDYAVYLVGKAGDGANAEQILSEFVTNNPGAVNTQNPAGSGQSNQAQTNNATNPANSTQFFTRTQLKDPTFYAANKDAIMQAAREGRIKDE